MPLLTRNTSFWPGIIIATIVIAVFFAIVMLISGGAKAADVALGTDPAVCDQYNSQKHISVSQADIGPDYSWLVITDPAIVKALVPLFLEASASGFAPERPIAGVALVKGGVFDQKGVIAVGLYDKDGCGLGASMGPAALVQQLYEKAVAAASGAPATQKYDDGSRPGQFSFDERRRTA